jgi:putative SOS response-associated peptidase YedK
MCGRFVRKATAEEICDEFELDPGDLGMELAPRYNIAPGQQAAAVLFDGRRKLAGLQWGLIPFWAKDPKIGYRMINARAETLASKPSFRNSLKKKRCLIVADGFYEWQKQGNRKTPMYLRLKSGKPFGFAGLFDDWKSPEGKDVRTCAIITTSANQLVKPIHDRMPVILPKDAYAAWLGQEGGDLGEALGLLRPFPEKEMDAYQVSPIVNRPEHDAPDCIQPV